MIERNPSHSKGSTRQHSAVAYAASGRQRASRLAGITTTGLLSMFAAGCGGDQSIVNDVNAMHDTHDDLTDAPTGPDTASWPFSPPDHAKPWVFDPAETFLPGDGTECGMDIFDETGGIRPCFSEIGPDRVSTLCDEGRGKCVAPTTRCTKGWCYVPPSMFLSGYIKSPLEVPLMHASMRSIKHAMWAQQTETTLGQFRAVMGYEPDFTLGCGDDCPVAGISIFEAMEFANRLSVAEGRQPCYVLEGCGDILLYPGGSLPDRPVKSWSCDIGHFPDPSCTGYRLPSSEEWELLARAGSPYCFPISVINGGGIDSDERMPIAEDYSVYRGTSDVDYVPFQVTRFDGGGPDAEPIGLQPVRTTLPNAFGLHEVHGNTTEYHFSLTYDTFNLGIPDDWNMTGLPPFLTSNIGGFIESITLDEPIASGGGFYFTDAKSTCGYSHGPAGISAAAVYSQAAGMRLVRTTPLRFEER